MCGIAGALGVTSDSRRLDMVRRMCDLQVHRGPDDDGLWDIDGAHCALGHRRLSVIDPSATGHQPMSSGDGRYVMTFNGEIFNHRHLRAGLVAEGVRFRGTSDSEVLVEAIAVWGMAETLAAVNGMFAFAVFDRVERKLHAARDPLGEKPLYWASVGGGIAFASELSALRSCPDVPREVDRCSMASFFRLGYIPAPHTPYVGVHKLAAGHCLTARLGDEPTIAPYWDPATLLGIEASADGAAFADIEALLTDSVRLRLEADVPVGVFLSSGIDSACVTALAASVSDRVRTFTVGFDEPSVDESGRAEAIAAHLGTEHQTLHVAADAGLDLVDAVATTYGEPFADPSAIPTMLLARAAREHVTVCLSGDGGDEVFGGYNRYLLGARAWPALSRVPRSLRQFAASAIRRLDPDLLDRLVSADRGPRSLRVRNAGDKIERLSTLLATNNDADLARNLVAVWPQELPINATPHPSSLDTVPPGLSGHGPVERMMFLDTITTLPDQMLVKVDRASMRASLEVRVPLLDRRVVSAAWAAPATLRLSGGETKRALRRIAERHLPAEMLDTPKIGFDPPIGRWLRGPLCPWAEDLLTVDMLRKHGLDPDAVRPLWAGYLAGRPSDYRVWSVLMYQSWAEQVD